MTIACHFSIRCAAVGGGFGAAVGGGFGAALRGGFGVSFVAVVEHDEYVVDDDKDDSDDISVKVDSGVGPDAGDGVSVGVDSCGRFAVIGGVSALGFGSFVFVVELGIGVSV